MALTGLVCATEINMLVRCLTTDQPPAITALVLAAFHVGYLAADRVAAWLKPRSAMAIAGVALIAVTMASITMPSSTFAVVALSVAGLVFNTVAQMLRKEFKSQVSLASVTKNTAKAAGMVVGGLLGAYDWAPLLLGIPGTMLIYCAFLARSRRHVGRVRARGPRRSKTLLWSEFLHHSHYFAYCYTFWYLAPPLVGPATGVWFLSGWLAYFVAEFVLRERRPLFSTTLMATGHAFVALSLIAMLYLPTPGVLLAWFLTGVGGGTAYMLGNAGPQTQRESYEDSGHVAGALLAAVASATAPGAMSDRATASTLVAASLAAVTAAAFLLAGRASTAHDDEKKAGRLTCA